MRLRHTWLFITRSEVGEQFAATSSAQARTVGRSSAAGTTRLTSPMRSASAASILRAENSRSSACAGPTRRGSSQASPHSAIRPRRAKAVVNTAVSEAKRRSAQQAIGTAIPAHGPLIAATTGLRTDIRYV